MPVRKYYQCYARRKGKYCTHPAVYWVWKAGSVNRYFCGYHAKRYLRLNKAQVLIDKIVGGKHSKPPYTIQTVEQ